MKKVTIFALVAILSFGMLVLPAFAEEAKDTKETNETTEFLLSETEKPTYRGTGKGEAMLADLIFLRPVGFASIGVGFVATIVGLPFSIIANNTREVGDAMLGETMNYTFVRPLGDNYQPLPLSEQQ
ncbi:MAG TPA: hypothetical protein PLR60_12800 [Syntrophorhabdaceae bacterium]|nr:hypothetical protein [Syntrophorhabdaceae bacterium]